MKDQNKAVHYLAPFEHEILGPMSKSLSENGFEIDDFGYIKSKSSTLQQSWVGAMIPGIVFGDKTAPDMNGGTRDIAACMIMNTESHGFRFVSSNANKEIVDLGPVTAPCIVGNVSKPEALLIPMNKSSLEEGLDIIQEFLSASNKKDESDKVVNYDEIVKDEGTKLII